MLKPSTQHLILLFIVGFTWGYVIKTLVGKYYYIGWDDPYVVSVDPIINLNTLHPSEKEASSIHAESSSNH